MRLNSRLLDRYIIASMAPYVALSVLLLTSILIAQQGGKYADILGNAQAPGWIAFEIVIDLIPNILLFTLPMSMLIGASVGFSRLGSDSEIIAMHAAGIGKRRILPSVLLFGFLLTLLNLYVGFIVAPQAAHDLHQIALRTALYKLESPVEPHTFNTEMPGKVVYVRDGDNKRGVWGRVFIYWQGEGEDFRLVTARSGRIDLSGDQSELVLSDAISTTLPAAPQNLSESPLKIITERSEQMRVRLSTGRNALLKKLQEKPISFDEMNWQQLIEQVKLTSGSEQRSAIIALHKRLALSCAPLAFAILGIGLGGYTNRGGRVFGVALSLAAMLIYYLISLGGEMLGHRGIFPPEIGPWFANALSLFAGIALLSKEKRHSAFLKSLRTSSALTGSSQRGLWHGLRGQIWVGLLDRTVIRTLFFSFLSAIFVLTAIFMIFTVFELLRFITSTGESLIMLAQYLGYLLPYALVELTPMSFLVAVLVVYALMARRSEAIAWWSGGQSTYRLALPCIFFSALIGSTVWLFQEKVLPITNHRQEFLRAQIKNGVSQASTANGRQWLSLANGQQIVSYNYEETSSTLMSPTVFKFDPSGIHLVGILAGREAHWDGQGEGNMNQATIVNLSSGRQQAIERVASLNLGQGFSKDLFKPILNKPSELNTIALSNIINVLNARKDADLILFSITLEKRRAAPLLPAIMAILGVPLAISFGRRSAVTAIGWAIILGASFWAMISMFQQMGMDKMLPPMIAIWSPLTIFTSLGLYLFARTRT